jgi:FdhD protein
MSDPTAHTQSLKVTAQVVVPQDRCVPREVPVAFVYDGSTYAVMMASPSNLEDFALGFSLTEGVIATSDEVENLEIVEQASGIELRMWLAAHRRRDLAERRRRMTGPTGCGLCGVESLDAAVPPPPRVTSELTVTAQDISAALAALAPAQTLNQETRAVHGAGFWTKERGLVAIAEDVGRHNALDKLIGGLWRGRIECGGGIAVLTSRVSVEMVQKTAVAGVPIVVAVSAPTELALRTADAAGITLIAVARADGFEIFTHPHRIDGLAPDRPKSKSVTEHAA